MATRQEARIYASANKCRNRGGDCPCQGPCQAVEAIDERLEELESDKAVIDHAVDELKRTRRRLTSKEKKPYVELDYHGHPVPTDETEDTEIMVWEIEPCLNTSYDYLVIRSYHDAMEHAQRVVESLMDDPDQEFPVTITIRQKTMTLREYEELCEDD